MVQVKTPYCLEKNSLKLMDERQTNVTLKTGMLIVNHIFN
jgi:hypothetical protein